MTNLLLSIDLLKNFTPFITFFLGIASTTFVERLKKKLNRRSALEAVKVELTDEVFWLEKKIRNMAESVISLNKLINGEGPDRRGKYVPPKSNLILLQENFKEISLLTSRSERFSLKTILVQSDALDGYLQEILNGDVSPERIKELVDFEKKYVYTACCMRYRMQLFLDAKKIELENDRAIVSAQLRELDMVINFDDLTSNKVTYSYSAADLLPEISTAMM